MAVKVAGNASEPLLPKIDVPSTPVEATIALSIGVVASALQRDEAERAQNMAQLDLAFLL